MGTDRDAAVLQDRAARVEQVVARTLTRRAGGEAASDAAVMAEHPDLVPELASALRTAAAVGRATRSSAENGDAVHVLSDEELDAPIEFDAAADITVDAGPAVAAAVPRFDGYDVFGMLPRGGQAVVYLARQASTGRAVAVKVLTAGRNAPAKARRRFDREARVLAALDHPCLVSVVDAGTADDGSPFLVMPYVDGPPLDEWLAVAPGRPGGRDPAAVLLLFERLARAVHAAHAADVVHRDLKPANVRVDANGEPRVLDFGLARLVAPDGGGPASVDGVTLDREVIGTLAWMSPEQAAGEADAVDGRADVYALGVMLYAAVAGRPPYPPGPAAATLAHVLATAPPPPSRSPSARPGLGWLAGRRIDAVVLQCLAKAPAGRYRTAALLADDLARCRAGLRPLATRARPLIPGRWWRLLLAGSVAAAVIVVVLLEAATLGLVGRPATTARPPGVAPGTRAGPVRRERNDALGGRYAYVPPGSLTTVDPRTGRTRVESVDRPFWIATTAVTRRAFAAVTAGGFAGLGAPSALVDPGRPQTDVSREDAAEFCRRLSRRQGLTIRLPTEAEWQLAARGGQVRPDARFATLADWCGGPAPVACGSPTGHPADACRIVPGGRADPAVGFRPVIEDPAVSGPEQNSGLGP